jgi:hypothetical protein
MSLPTCLCMCLCALSRDINNNSDVQRNNFSEMDNTWWWPYTAETCSEEVGWLDNMLYLRRKYMCTKDTLMQRDFKKSYFIR